MIPVDFNENIKYKDEQSGVVFSLRPMVGPNEAKVVDLLTKNGEEQSVSRSAIDQIFDMFVAGWSHDKLLLPAFPEKNQHQFFTMSDRNKMVLDVILKFTKEVTAEEKKS